MRILVSGEAGFAVAFSNERVAHCLSVDETEPIEFPASRASRMLCGCDDLVEYEVENWCEVQRLLDEAWVFAHSLQLVLVILDTSRSQAVREEAAEALIEVYTPAAWTRIERILFSAPLPETDISSTRQLHAVTSHPEISATLEQLADSQQLIKDICETYDALPVNLFGGLEEKANFRRTARIHGVFHDFLASYDNPNTALLKLLASPEYRGDAQARGVFLAWAEPFRASVCSTKFPAHLPDERALTDRTAIRSPRHHNRREAFQNVQKQKNAIKALLIEGRTSQAYKYIQQLISSQRSSSQPEHICKTLCDLSQYAKELGDYSLQLQLAEWAVKEFDDGWAYAQLADAYRSAARFQDSLTTYERAGSLGEGRVALCGRASVFRDIGLFGDALSIYDSCLEAYPAERVAMHGRAEVLKDQGRFQEAILEYRRLAAEDPYDSVTICGLATALRDVGNFDEAIQLYHHATDLNHDNLVSRNGLAEALRCKGELRESLRAYQKVIKSHPHDYIGQLGLAGVHKDLGQLRQAVQCYDAILKLVPYMPSALAGAADVYRMLGNKDKAIKLYNRVLESNPKFLHARAGLASCIGVGPRANEALMHLPKHLPATLGEWSAYRVRGLLLLKAGNIQDAEAVFAHGISCCPWHTHKPRFASAMASLLMKQDKTAEAAAILPLGASGILANVCEIIEALPKSEKLAAVGRQARHSEISAVRLFAGAVTEKRRREVSRTRCLELVEDILLAIS